MASSKKKKSSTLILLLVVMIAMIGACFWLIKYKDQQAAEQSEESAEEDVIATVDTDSVESIYFSNDAGEMTLVRKEDEWKKSDDELFPVNQTYVSSMLTGLSSVTSSRTITEDTDDLSVFGLDTPAIQVTATLEDGTTTSIAMGDKAPLNGGYYATLNGSSDVYIISETFYNYFVYSVEDMAVVETIPSITAEYITHLKIENKDKPNFEINYDEKNTSDYASFTYWTMKQPYATDVPADPETVATLLGNYTSMSFLSCVDYDAEDLSIYGLDDPTATISLNYYEVYTKETESSDTTDSTDTTNTAGTNTTEDESTKIYHDYTLVIGSQDEDGNYYAKSEDSNAVHTISADTVDTLLTIDAYSNVYHYVNMVNINDIDKLDIKIDGKTYALTVDRTQTTTDEESTESTEDSEDNAVYFFNGTELEKSAFTDLYQILISPTTERDIPSEYFESNASQVPSLTLEFHFVEGKTVTIKYLPYDESYYVVDSNGIQYFLADARKVNEIIDTVKNYQPK